MLSSQSKQADTVTVFPSDVLLNVGQTLSGREVTTVTLPRVTTCKDAIDIATAGIANLDATVMIMKPLSRREKEALRMEALREVEPSDSQTRFSHIRISPNTKVNTDFTPSPAPINTKERLRENAKSWEPVNKDPYITQVRATAEEKRLAAVSGILRLNGCDSEHHDPIGDVVCHNMLWDTGAHSCTITEDLLDDEFRAYLRSPQHEPYRNNKRTLVQVDGLLAYSNTDLEFSCIFEVVSTDLVPNRRSGVILGQRTFLDSLVYKSIPRNILIAKGQTVGEEIWGDLIFEEFVTLFQEIQQL
ncbi:MAG: hypothetical protein M1819_006824 [Sarea resinae]|nr:MAG: hypothetical protein M1819_006824 [Sarea resinae]